MPSLRYSGSHDTTAECNTVAASMVRKTLSTIQKNATRCPRDHACTCLFLGDNEVKKVSKLIGLLHIMARDRPMHRLPVCPKRKLGDCTYSHGQDLEYGSRSIDLLKVVIDFKLPDCAFLLIIYNHNQDDQSLAASPPPRNDSHRNSSHSGKIQAVHVVLSPCSGNRHR
jgi:hypothetical protein